MFQSVRFKLTLWYVVISMLISVFFSLTIFYIIDRNIIENYRRAAIRYQRDLEQGDPFLPLRPPPMTLSQLENAENGVKSTLMIINLVILGVSSVAGYMLAGKTLRPIKTMVDEQNRFISDSSHELRTPLTALKSTIEVALRDKSLTAKEAREALESNLEEVNNMQALSENLLLLSQYENQKNSAFPDVVSLKEAIAKSVKLVSGLAKKKNISLNVSLHDANVTGDEGRLTQLFVIFLDNAIKYSHESGTISVTSIKKGNHAEVNISDQGIGIDKKDLPHIFDRFYRANKARNKTTESGYGLGLSIAKKIIEIFNGSVNVQSQPEKGTTFSIRLPLVA